jgi:dihydropteroate synthase
MLPENNSYTSLLKPTTRSGCLAELGHRTLIMGILNVTPDSFSDGGLFVDEKSALEQAYKMIEDGADIIDVGGESTRPGSDSIPIEIELERVLPVIDKLSKTTETCISIDTYKSVVAKKALEMGACIVNDISALSDPNMASVVAETGSPIVLMHKKGIPKDMQVAPHYDSLISEISEFLQEKIQVAVESGISPEQIIIDPGIGFGKTVAHNLEILRNLREFKALGKPILVGTSRKSFIGKILNVNDATDRVDGTSATVAIAIANGADLVRVHDVKEIVRVARMADAIVKGIGS